MRRRDFITLIGSTAVTWPLAASAQQSAIPLVGILNQGSPQSDAFLATAFRKGLRDSGYLETRNVAVVERWAENQYDRLPQLAAELVGRKVFVIATSYVLATRAAMAATTVIPIVFVTGTDPVQSGLVSSLNRPHGNVTGVAMFDVLLGAKKLGLLRDLLPSVSTVGLLFNPTNAPVSGPFLKNVQAAAREVALQIVGLSASTEREIDNSFATSVEQRIGALIITPDAFLQNRQDQIIALAARHAIPAMYDRRENVIAGGLMSYGTNFQDSFSQQGIYVGRILRGEKPANLPVIQATRFEFVLNLKTAKTLNLTISPGLLAIADEVIE